PSPRIHGRHPLCRPSGIAASPGHQLSRGERRCDARSNRGKTFRSRSRTPRITRKDPRLMANRYLDPEGLARLGSLELVARQVVEGFLTGRHRSPYHGFSVEYLDHRSYVPGDEVRTLDWKIVARTNKYY